MGRLGVPKREVLNAKSGHKSKTKTECAEAKIVEKPKENTHILDFHNRARLKKKEVEGPKLKFKNGKRNLAPNRGQNDVFWAPKRAPNRSKNRVQKTSRKKVREKSFEPHRPGSRRAEYRTRKRRTTNFGVWAPPNLKLKFNI